MTRQRSPTSRRRAVSNAPRVPLEVPVSASGARRLGLFLVRYPLFPGCRAPGRIVRLVISDYDPVERTLLVRTSKFHKSRLVALSKSVADELERYLRVHRRLPHHADARLLVGNHRGLRAYSGASFGLALRRLFRVADVRMPDGHFPRVHDLRHSFGTHAALLGVNHAIGYPHCQRHEGVPRFGRR